jgi:hypothetical protein
MNNKSILDMTREERVASIIDYLEHMEPFENEDRIPHIPTILSKEEYEKYLVSNFIRCGAIPKSKLIDGQEYIGDCRNSRKAIWVADKNQFKYMRYKFGSTYEEYINHFEDDNGFDLFVPIKLNTGH